MQVRQSRSSSTFRLLRKDGAPRCSQRQRDARQLLDTTLIVGETRVEAHKLVLLSLSPYLNALFLSGFRESGADKGDVIVGDEHTNQHGYLTNACTGGGIQPRSTRCGVHPFTWL